MILHCYCLPSQTTHELQPMDKSVFGTSEHYWDEQVLLFYSHSTDRTLTKHRFGTIFTEAWDKAATPANIKEGFHATGVYPFNPSVIPDRAFAPSLVTPNEDTQVSNSVTVFEMPAAAPLSQKKTHKASPVPGKSSRVVSSTSNPDVVSAGRDDDADMKGNAITTPSQQIPEHSRVLTPKSFRSILSTPWKFLTNARRSMSLDKSAVVLKTNLFSVKQPLTRMIRNVLLVLLGERKEQNPVHRSLNEIGSLLSAIC